MENVEITFKLGTDTYLSSRIAVMGAEIVDKLQNVERNVSRGNARTEDLNTISIGLEHILNTLRLNAACKGDK